VLAKTKIISLVLILTGFLSSLFSFTPPDSISLTAEERTQVQQGEIILRDLSTEDSPGQTFEAIGLINAPRVEVVQVLIDYERYPEFMPNVTHVEIVGESGSEATLNYILKLPLGIIKKYRIQIALMERDSLTSIIEWQYRDWPGLKQKETIRDTKGFWQIEEVSPETCLVWYQVYSDPGPVPFGFGWIVNFLTQTSFPDAFQQTKFRAEAFDSIIDPI